MAPKQPKAAVLTMWRGSGSRWIGKCVVKSFSDKKGRPLGESFLMVFGWLPKEASEFVDARGRAAPLYRAVHFVEHLRGDVEDLEEQELMEAPFEPDEWKRSGSDWLGRTLTRTPKSGEEEVGVVCGWKSEAESGFVSVRPAQCSSLTTQSLYCAVSPSAEG
jgi:hypothetical protein